MLRCSTAIRKAKLSCSFSSRQTWKPRCGLEVLARGDGNLHIAKYHKPACKLCRAVKQREQAKKVYVCCYD